MDFRKIVPMFLVIFILGVSIIGTHSVYAAPNSEQHTTTIKIDSVLLYAFFEWEPSHPPFSKKIMNDMIRPKLYVESQLYVDGKTKICELIHYDLYNDKNQKIAQDWDKTGIIIPATGTFDIKNLPTGKYTIVASNSGDFHAGLPSTSTSYTFFIVD